MQARRRNGDDGDPNSPPVAGQEDDFDQDGDEAKILVQTDSGTISFHGPHGPRWNVPAGSGDEPGNESPQHGGDGAHMALVAMHDPDPNSTEGNTGTFGGQPQADHEWRAGWQSGSVYVAQSGGTEFIAHLWAGIDVLGIGPERCVFGGSVYVVKG